MTIWKRLDSQTTGVAIYNFNENGDHRLRLELGEKVQILEENMGWYRGFSLRNKNVQGIFPVSYIHVKKFNGQAQSSQDSSFKEDSVLEELTSVLREWGVMWKILYLRKQEDLFKIVQKLMLDLMDWRRQILSGKLPRDQLKQLKSKITAAIDYGNRILGLDLVVRDDDGNIIDPDATGVIELYRRHLSTSNKAQSSQEDNKQSTRVGYTTHCMYVNLKNVVCKINDDAQVFVALYDAKEQQFISEQYMVSWDRAGMPKQIDKLGNLSIVFTDLGSKDLIRERMYIVCQIVRVGRMDQKENDNKKFTHQLRRAFGVCVLFIGNYITGKDQVDEDKEHFLQLYPVTAENKTIESSIKECISRAHETGKGTDEGVFLSIKLLHGDIEQVREDYPLLVNKHTTIARKQGFPEVIMPGDVRNDMYVTVLQGEFERGRKTTSKNIEVTMQVCLGNGELVKGVISLGAGDEMVDEYHSVIYYHVGSPKWSETVKLQIPIEQFKSAHLKFTFRHRPRHEEKDKTQKVFASSYTPLMHNDGTTLLDGSHDLLVYECEGKKLDPKMYLQLPSCRGEIGLMSPSKASIGSHGMHVSIRESFQITTLLCSTKLTQNVDLLGLLKWRSMQGKLKDILVTVMKVSGEEIVKFLTDTFDALFAILMENAQKYDKLVFDALVFTINMLADKKYHHFRPVLDAYIETRYNATKAYVTLMLVLRQYVDSARGKADKQKLDLLLKAMKAIEYIFKFIVQSRVLYERAIGDKGRSEFEEELRQLFTSLVQFMEDKKNETVLTQGACLKYFPSTFGDLLKVFDAKELGHYARDLIRNIPKGRLISQRMACVHHMVKSKLFSNPDSRSVLLPMIVQQLGEDMTKCEEMKMCMDILNEMLISLTRDNVGDTHGDVLQVVTSLLRVVVKVVITMDRTQPVVGNCVACLTAMLHLMDEEHYRQYIDHFPSRIELLDFLMELFLLFREFVSNNMYPKDWMVMTMLQNSVILNAIQYFSEALLETFMRSDYFENQVWNNFFHLAVAFITQESLQLENFSSAKQNKILEKYSDMRMIIGLKIIDMWQCLGSNKGKFIPGLVGPFLEMTLIPQEELRRATIPIFHDMIDCEFRSQGDFMSVEAEVISKLDVLVEGGKGDERYKDLFYKLLNDLFKKHPTLYEIGTNFVALVTKLMERLLDYRTVIQGDDSIDNRMSCTVNVLDFYKEIRREEMYIRYVYKLCDLHISVENYTEAAFTLRLHADLLNWSDEPVHSRHTGKYSASTQRQLKEILYKEIIEYFEKGKTWEYAIHFCKKLSEQYEEHTFDFIELSQVLMKQAKFYDNIITVVRGDPEYFRVGFYGKAFPTFLRNRVFVYRGKEFEKLGEFTVRIKSQYPNAKVLTYITPPDDEVKNSPTQHLQINKVDPVPVEWRRFQGKNVMEQITKFYEVNHVNKFQFSRPFHKSKVDKEKEFASLWLQRTILYTKDKFPGNLCWFEVTNSFVEEISPIRYALETMELTTKQLRSLIGRHKTDAKLSINPLSMKLNGIIDAAVMGGISNYEKAFLIPEYQQENPDDAHHVNRLKELIVEQVHVLEEGITLHAVRVPESLKPFHEKMEKCFKDMKQKIAPLRRQSRLSTPSISRTRPQELQTRPSLIHRDSMDLPPASLKFDGRSSPPPLLPEKEKRKQTLTLSPGDFPNYSFKPTPGGLTPTKEEDDPPPPPKPVRKVAQNGAPPRLPDKIAPKIAGSAGQRGSTGSNSSGDNEYVADPTDQAPKLPPRRPTLLDKETRGSPPVPPKRP